MKPPDACADMAEIRAEIDRIDREVIRALGERFGYVKAAAKFKTGEESVRAPERFAAMLRQRREWAAEAGLDPDVVERLYRDLVTYFIEEELRRFRALVGSPGNDSELPGDPAIRRGVGPQR